MSRRLVAIRPYHAAIRTKVFEVLSGLGFQREHVTVIPAATPDTVALEQLRDVARPDGLLVPFHAHKDERGDQVDGLTLLMRLWRELPTWKTVPVMMPVSQVVLGAVQLRVKEVDPDQRSRLNLVNERDLDDTAAVVSRLKAAGM